MTIHHLTPPIRGGERPRLPSSQIGPVTQAIRAMRAPSWHLHADDICELRRRIAERIEVLRYRLIQGGRA